MMLTHCLMDTGYSEQDDTSYISKVYSISLLVVLLMQLVGQEWSISRV